MKISVALCTYNGSKYLRDQLNSLFSQSRKVDEIVVCDDQSTDSTMDILHAFKKQYPEVLNIRQNNKKLGARNNFENAISVCSGDIIFLCDQDDIWYDSKVAVSVDWLAMHPQMLGVFCNGNLISKDKVAIKQTMWDNLGFNQERRSQLEPKDLFNYLLINGNIASGTTIAIRKEAKKYILPFYLPADTWHDHWIALMLSAIHKFHCIDKPLLDYRIHKSQLVGFDVISNQKTSGSTFKSSLKIDIQTIEKCDEELTMKIVHAISRYQLFKSAIQQRCNVGECKLDAFEKQLNQLLYHHKKSWLKKTIPFVPRKIKILKHWLKGGEYLQMSFKDIFTI
ncbi:MAG: glycosyltransferase [Bacteroidia bacterium]|nr:MAG: glycosyltransferase [Bacteroidia bacterium]